MPKHPLAPAVPILMYHQVARGPTRGFEKYTVTAAAFTAQVHWLASAGYRAIGLDTLLAHRDAGAPLPPRTVVITFDDGYQECVECVMPVLQSHGLTATFYLVAGLLGQRSTWLRLRRGFDLPLADLAMARELAAAGFTCGAHSMTHPPLTELAPDACRRELSGSRQVLEDALGHVVRHMAYPYGRFDPHVRRMVSEAGYASACSVLIGLSPPDDDPFALRRVPVLGTDSLPDFVWRLRTARPVGEFVRGKVRGAWRRLRTRAG